MKKLFAILSIALISVVTLLSTTSCSKNDDTPVEESNKIHLSSDSLDKEGGYSYSVTLKVSANPDVQWTVTSNEDWCTITDKDNIAPVTRGRGEVWISINLTQNDGEARDCIVTFRSGNQTIEYKVTQGKLIPRR